MAIDAHHTPAHDRLAAILILPLLAFLAVLVAGFFGDRFRERAYFKAQAGADVAPKVAF